MAVFDERQLCLVFINLVSVTCLPFVGLPLIRTWSPTEEVNEQCKDSLVELIDIGEMF